MKDLRLKSKVYILYTEWILLDPRIMKDLRLKSKVYWPINSLFAINGQLKIHVYEKVNLKP